ncbi:MAG: adenosylcobinamide-GDP ribazoletransferase [Actinomycetota bacterium]|nr:adenosylcobinamide-GDP ribazoletransferase [Actinomycetota bacterium]
MTAASDAAGALAFLTPVGGGRAPSPESFRWFPAVGASMGLALGGVWWAGSQLWPAPVAAAVVVTADLAFTGMLHLDGLIDAADGLLPHLDRERRLEVMADPTVGAFGVGVATSVLLLRWAALSAMPPRPLLLAGLWCASRTAMGVVARSVPYARSSGLASAFLAADSTTGADAAFAGVGLMVSLAMTRVGGGAGPMLAVGGLAAGVAAVTALARRRIGGFTGDVLGAAGLVGETVGLAVAAARSAPRKVAR